MLCCIADNLLSLALDVMPQCVGHLLTSDVSRIDKVVQIVDTLMMNGAVLVPYPCSRLISTRRSVLHVVRSFVTVCVGFLLLDCCLGRKTRSLFCLVGSA